MPLPRSKPLSPTERGESMLNPDMVREAARLTRAGQIVEATALLQRMLRGDGGPAATATIAIKEAASLTGRSAT